MKIAIYFVLIFTPSARAVDCVCPPGKWYYYHCGATTDAWCSDCNKYPPWGKYWTGPGSHEGGGNDCPVADCTNTPANGNYFSNHGGSNPTGCQHWVCDNIAGEYYTGAGATSSSSCPKAACTNSVVGKYFTSTWTTSATGCTHGACTNAANGQTYTGSGGTNSTGCPVASCSSAVVGQYYTTPNSCAVAACDSPSGQYWTLGGGTTATSCGTSSCNNALANQYYTSHGGTSPTACNRASCTTATAKQYYSRNTATTPAPGTDTCPVTTCTNTPPNGFYWSQGGGTTPTSCLHSLCNNALANNQYYSGHGDVSAAGCAKATCTNTLPHGSYWSNNGFANATNCSHTPCSNKPQNSTYVPNAVNLNPTCAFLCDAGFSLNPVTQTCPTCPQGTFSSSPGSVCTPCIQGVHYPNTNAFVRSTQANTRCDWDCVGGFIRAPDGTTRCLSVSSTLSDSLVLQAFAIVHDETPTQHLLRLVNISSDHQTTETIFAYNKTDYALALPTVHRTASFLYVADGPSLSRVSKISLIRPFNSTPTPLAGSYTTAGSAVGLASQARFSGISRIATTDEADFIVVIDQNYQRLTKIDEITGQTTLLLSLPATQAVTDVKLVYNGNFAYLALYQGSNFDGTWRSPHFTCPAGKYYSESAKACKVICPLSQYDNGGTCAFCEFPVRGNCGRITNAATGSSNEFPVILTPYSNNFACVNSAGTSVSRTTCYPSQAGTSTNCVENCYTLYHAVDYFTQFTIPNWAPLGSSAPKRPLYTIDYSVPVRPVQLSFALTYSETSAQRFTIQYSENNGVYYGFTFSPPCYPSCKLGFYVSNLPYRSPKRFWRLGYADDCTGTLAKIHDFAYNVECQPGSYTEHSSKPRYCLKCPPGTFSTYAGATTCTHCPAGTSGNGLWGQSSHLAACTPLTWSLIKLDLNTLQNTTIAGGGTNATDSSGSDVQFWPILAIACTNDYEYIYVLHQHPTDASAGLLRRVHIVTGEVKTLLSSPLLLSSSWTSAHASLSLERIWVLAPPQRSFYQVILFPNNNTAALEIQYGSASRSGSVDDTNLGPQHVESFTSPLSFSVWKCRRDGQDCFSNWEVASPCQPGTSSVLGRPCLPCDRGTFAPALQSSACAACPLATYADARGADSCIPCARSYHYPTHAAINSTSPTRTRCDYACDAGYNRVFASQTSDDCVNFNNSRALLAFATTVSKANLTRSEIDRLGTAVSRALNIPKSRLSTMLSRPSHALNMSAPTPASARRLLASPAQETTVYFVVHASPPSPAASRRLLQQQLEGDSYDTNTLYLVLESDTSQEAYSLANQVNSTEFQALLAQACAEQNVSTATVDQQSVQYLNIQPPEPTTMTTTPAPTTSTTTTPDPTTSTTTTAAPTTTTAAPTTSSTTAAPTTTTAAAPTTSSTTTEAPTTSSTTTAAPTTSSTTTAPPTTSSTTTAPPTTSSTTAAPTTTAAPPPRNCTRGVHYPMNAALVNTTDPASPICNFNCDPGYNLLVTNATRDCVLLNTSKPLFTFTITIPLASLTPQQITAYTLAVARALGISPARLTPLLRKPQLPQASRRRLLSESNSTCIQFIVDIDHADAESQPANTSANRRRLLSTITESYILYAVDALALELLYALAMEITTDSFQARVNQAAQDLNLAPAIVDPASVEMINAPQIAQETPIQTTQATQTPAPPAPPAPPPALRSSANSTSPHPALLTLATLFALAYILPVGDADYYD